MDTSERVFSIHDILNNIITPLTKEQTKFFSKFSKLQHSVKEDTIQTLYKEYCNCIREGIKNKEPEIKIDKLGTFVRNKYRDLYLDLIKDGIDKEQAILICKDTFHTDKANGTIKKNIL